MKLKKVICKHCDLKTPIRVDGTLRSHKPPQGGSDCPGTYTKDYTKIEGEDYSRLNYRFPDKIYNVI
jgi:hypothetical protein